jgi:hypothetical protein
MAKVYFVRHQAGGVMHEYPFAKEPSDAQVAALSKLCFQRFGATHPKNNAAYWARIVEVELLGPSDVPKVPDQGPSVVSEAGLSKLSVSAAGTVTSNGDA